MLSHTLISAALSSVLTVGISLLSLTVALVALYLSYTKIHEQSGKISRYAQNSKFHQVQIRHHESRLTQLEKKRRVKTIPMVSKNENLKEAN